MSAYLSHIAELSLGHLTPIEPRLPSHFEQVGVNASPESFQESNIEYPAKSVRESNASDQNEHSKPQDINIEEPKMLQPSKNSVVNLTDNALNSRTSQVTQHLNQISNIHPIVEKTKTYVERVQEQFFTETANKETVIREHIVHSANPTVRRDSEHMHHEKANAPAKVQAVSVQPNIMPSTNNVHSNLQFRSENSTETTAPESIINVTIGRIEIRATTDSSKVTTITPSAPKTMSLDDYLNRRNGSKS